MTRATYLTFFGSARGAAAGHHHGDEHGEEHELEVHDDVHAHDDAHAHDTHTTVANGHDAHDDHHEPVHAAPAFGIKGESPYLLVLPLIVLSFLAVVSGYLNSAPFHIEKFHHWMESSIGVEVPEAAEFKWINAVPSIVLVALGVLVSALLCKAVFGEAASRLKGLTHRSKVLGAGHTFLVNKYYLDALYENVIVHAVAHPIAKAAYWVNQHVLDGVVNAVGLGGKRTGEWLYRNVDQRVVDGAVNGSGSVARGTGGALRPLQSGKVNQYGALLFSAAAIAALVLVIVNT